MKKKLVIFENDHTNRAIRVRKKHLSDSDVISVKGETFFTDDENFQITEERIGIFFSRKFITYYYDGRDPHPLPIHDFRRKLEALDLDDVPGRRELNAIFNPWFLRVISARAMTGQEKLLLIAAIAGAVFGAFSVYQIMGMPERIVDAVGACLQDPTSVCNTPPPTPEASGA